jgi:RNA polymerase sigma factor (TIGR02999 family)
MEAPDRTTIEADEWASLTEAAGADPGAKERLFTSLYRELHRRAEYQLRSQPGVAISPTTLLHETYLHVLRGRESFPDSDRFMGYAVRVMRNLIIDFARERRAQKRGGNFEIIQLNTHFENVRADEGADGASLQRLSTALDELAARDARLAEIVDLKYFCGLSAAEIAGLRGVSERTVLRDWEKARLFLYRELNEDGVG